MRHLKKFNESNDDDDIIGYLKDICLEIGDMGFKVDIFKPYSRKLDGRSNNIIIDISQDKRSSWWSNNDKVRNDEQFLYGSTMDHVENYMEVLGYKMNINHNLPATSQVDTPHHITYTFTKLS